MKKQSGTSLPEVIILIGIIIVAVVGGMAMYHEAKQWEQFKIDHACVVVEKISPTTNLVTTVSSDGNTHFGTVSDPGKTAWKCNDGVTYWR